MNILLLIGIILILALIGGKLLKAIKSPQVVGYILVGVLLGPSLLDILSEQIGRSLEVLAFLALGLIGFGIGSQLRYSDIRRLGNTIISIVILEALGAFLLTAIGVFILTREIHIALIFGALASATAPAATVDVLEEYESKGPLTTTLLAVVGLDDAAALIIYGFASAIAKVSMGVGDQSILSMLVVPLKEIGGSLMLGGILGFILSRLTRRMRNRSELLVMTLGTILVACGLANILHFSLILASMMVGLMTVNFSPFASRRIQEAIGGFTPPIYFAFFALVGARLNIRLLPQMGLIGIIYIVARALGKFGGAYLGAKISHAVDSVRKYLGFALFSQAGVAIGLALAIATEFRELGPAGQQFGEMTLNVITATTFVVQLIGPPLTKYAIVKAGEVGRASLRRRRK